MKLNEKLLYCVMQKDSGFGSSYHQMVCVHSRQVSITACALTNKTVLHIEKNQTKFPALHPFNP